MTSVLVTGAGGFVCSNLIHVFVELGYQVVALDRQFDPVLRALWADKPVEFVETDAVQLPSIKVDYFIHGAAITASPEDRNETPEANFRANIDPLLAALEWASEHKIKRGVFISSGGVFSQNTQDIALTEDMVVEPYGLYTVAKKTMEDIVTTLNGLYKRSLVTIRLSNIYGPFERPRPTRVRVSMVSRFIHQALTEQRITVPHDAPKRDWTFAPDIGYALHSLLQKPILNHSLYHLTSGQTFTPLEIARALQSLIPNVQLEDETSPSRAGWLAGKFWSQDVGFTAWTPFTVGLEKTLAWHLERVA
jgi:UDP-glucose 4-epimerase